MWYVAIASSRLRFLESRSERRIRAGLAGRKKVADEKITYCLICEADDLWVLKGLCNDLRIFGHVGGVVVCGEHKRVRKRQHALSCGEGKPRLRGSRWSVCNGLTPDTPATPTGKKKVISACQSFQNCGSK